MTRCLRAPAVVTALAAASLLSACGSVVGYAIPSWGNATTTLVAKILVDLPPAERAVVHLAIAQVNAAHTSEFQNVRLLAVDLDDYSNGDADVGVAKHALRGYLHDPSVLGMIGPLNADIAVGDLPLANQADLAVISPDLTQECLTASHAYCPRGEPYSLRPHNSKPPNQLGDLTFFRIPATQDVQGSSAADYTFDVLHGHRAYVLSDQTSSGQNLGASFQRRWQLKGGALAGGAQVDFTRTPDAGALAGTIAATRADVLYVASGDGGKFVQLVRALHTLDAQAGTPLTVVGPDGLHTSNVAAALGSGHVYVTSLATDPMQDGSHFAAAYRAAGLGSSPPPYALEAYQATQILVEAIRQAMVAQLQNSAVGLPTADSVHSLVESSTSYATEGQGTITFDGGGDDTSRLVTYYRLDKGAWTFADQVQAS